MKENFPEKIEAVADLTMAIRHAIQRGINSGRFVKEGRYVKLSDKYQARDAEKSAQKTSMQRELKEKVDSLLCAVCSFCLSNLSEQLNHANFFHL